MTAGEHRRPAWSLNQMTVARCTVAGTIAVCERAGVPSVGLWREPVARAGGAARVASLIAASGLRVSSLCRGGFLTSTDPKTRAASLADNRRAIDEAAALGAACLVLVVGGLSPGSRDLPGARHLVSDGIGALAGYAKDRGVRLALEPMHPLYCADRGVVSTLAQALDIAGQFPADQVGVVVDSFHTWWDPELAARVARAADRIASVQISDWITPLPPGDSLLIRGMIGDGHIDLDGFLRMVLAAGYRGDIEVEIFNAAIAAADPHSVVTTVATRFAALTADLSYR